MDRWPERLGGRAVRAVDAHGKHLYLRFEGDLTLHSHLRMTGRWGVYARGGRWTRSPRRAWLVIRTPDHEVVQFDGPVLELMTDSRTRFDRRLTGLGPDILADEFDKQRYLRRLREDDQTRGIGDAVLDQRNVAGIGNIWKSEGCFAAEVDPWRKTRGRRATAAVDSAPLMRRSAERGGHMTALRGGPAAAAARLQARGRQCRRCGSTIGRAGQGDDNRTTYWCPGCQRLEAGGPQGRRPHRARQHGRVVPAGARREGGHDRVRRASAEATGASCWPTTTRTPRNALRSRSSEGLDHFAERGLRRRRAGRGPQAARLRTRGGARGS